MTDKTKNLFLYGGSVILGLFSLLIFWQLPYLSLLNGFTALSFWGQLGTFGVLLALAQLFIFFALIALIAVGTIGILNTLEITKLEFKHTTFSLKLLNLILLGAVVFLNVFVLIWCACIAAQNSGILFGVGSVIALAFSIAFVVFAALEFAEAKRTEIMSEISQKYDEDQKLEDETTNEE